jgi:Peptidase C39 family
MNPNWLGIISAIMALLVFRFAYQAARKLDLPQRRHLALLSLFLALPGASFALYYTHLLPETAWYYQFRSIRGTEILTVFLGFSGGVIASLLPRPVLPLPLLSVAAFILAPCIKPILGPIPPDDFANGSWLSEVCMQSTPSTCGPACAATILKQLGEKPEEAELATAAYSSKFGTEAWYLARAVRKMGFTAQFHIAPGFDPNTPLPAIFGVRFGSVGHFITILGREGDGFLLGDPLRGKELLTQELLLKRYDFTGFSLTITPAG